MLCEYGVMPALFGIATGTTELCTERVAYRYFFTQPRTEEENRKRLNILYYCQYHGEHTPFGGLVEEL